jgi:hypothetical protein
MGKRMRPCSAVMPCGQFNRLGKPPNRIEICTTLAENLLQQAPDQQRDPSHPSSVRRVIEAKSRVPRWCHGLGLGPLRSPMNLNCLSPIRSHGGWHRTTGTGHGVSAAACGLLARRGFAVAGRGHHFCTGLYQIKGQDCSGTSQLQALRAVGPASFQQADVCPKARGGQGSTEALACRPVSPLVSGP